eukprot:TRINITY_DN28079_c0_g1_i1.p1 TRINITY_DN28079_c0_g1~~TRINITY_DN28079_c0_g1_i1.p1  ORF type:complete len:915 (+),score=245.28 TRINITY_DN28079_c0_g1_i1:158-2902(+)
MRRPSSRRTTCNSAATASAVSAASAAAPSTWLLRNSYRRDSVESTVDVEETEAALEEQREEDAKSEAAEVCGRGLVTRRTMPAALPTLSSVVEASPERWQLDAMQGGWLSPEEVERLKMREDRLLKQLHDMRRGHLKEVCRLRSEVRRRLEKAGVAGEHVQGEDFEDGDWQLQEAVDFFPAASAEVAASPADEDDAKGEEIQQLHERLSIVQERVTTYKSLAAARTMLFDRSQSMLNEVVTKSGYKNVRELLAEFEGGFAADQAAAANDEDEASPPSGSGRRVSRVWKRAGRRRTTLLHATKALGRAASSHRRCSIIEAERSVEKDAETCLLKGLGQAADLRAEELNNIDLDKASEAVVRGDAMIPKELWVPRKPGSKRRSMAAAEEFADSSASEAGGDAGCAAVAQDDSGTKGQGDSSAEAGQKSSAVASSSGRHMSVAPGGRQLLNAIRGITSRSGRWKNKKVPDAAAPLDKGASYPRLLQSSATAGGPGQKMKRCNTEDFACKITAPPGCSVACQTPQEWATVVKRQRRFRSKAGSAGKPLDFNREHRCDESLGEATDKATQLACSARSQSGSPSGSFWSLDDLLVDRGTSPFRDDAFLDEDDRRTFGTFVGTGVERQASSCTSLGEGDALLQPSSPLSLRSADRLTSPSRQAMKKLSRYDKQPASRPWRQLLTCNFVEPGGRASSSASSSSLVLAEAAPQASEVHSATTEKDHVEALRDDLSAKKVTELRRMAVSEGVMMQEEDVATDGLEEEEGAEALIELLVQGRTKKAGRCIPALESRAPLPPIVSPPASPQQRPQPRLIADKSSPKDMTKDAAAGVGDRLGSPCTATTTRVRQGERTATIAAADATTITHARVMTPKRATLATLPSAQDLALLSTKECLLPDAPQAKLVYRGGGHTFLTSRPKTSR